jgi:RimJ/RimL family protein N-acetyltransferase
MSSSSSDLLFGIFDTETNHHIGNIKISGINKTHRFAELGLLIGEIRYHGKGVGSRAIQLACLIASRDLNLNKLVAGMNAENFGSYKAFIKSGFREVGRYQKHRMIDGNWLDEIIVEKVL